MFGGEQTEEGGFLESVWFIPEVSSRFGGGFSSLQNLASSLV